MSVLSRTAMLLFAIAVSWPLAATDASSGTAEARFLETCHVALDALIARRRDDARTALQKAEAIAATLPGEQGRRRQASPRLLALRYLVAAGYAEYGQKQQAAQLLTMNVGQSMGPGMHTIIQGDGGAALMERLSRILVAAQTGDLEAVKAQAQGLMSVAPAELDLTILLAQAEMLAMIQNGGSPVDHPAFAETARRLLPRPDTSMQNAEARTAAAARDGLAADPTTTRLQSLLERFQREHGQPLTRAYMAQSYEAIASGQPVPWPGERLQAAERLLDEIMAGIDGLPPEQGAKWRRDLLFPLGSYVRMSGLRPRSAFLREAGDCAADMPAGLDGTLADANTWILRCAPTLTSVSGTAVALASSDEIRTMALADLERLTGELRGRDDGNRGLVLRVQHRMVQLMLLRGEVAPADALAIRMRADTARGEPAHQARALLALAESSLSLGEAARAERLLEEARSKLAGITLPEDDRFDEIRVLLARAQAIRGDDDRAVISYRGLIAERLVPLEAFSLFQRLGLREDLGRSGPVLLDLMRSTLDVPAEQFGSDGLDVAIVTMELLLENGQATLASDWRRIRDAARAALPGDIRLAALDIQIARLLARDGKPHEAAREARSAVAVLAQADGRRSWLHPRDPRWWSEPTRHVLFHVPALLAPGGSAQGEDADALFLAVQMATRDESGQSVQRMRARIAQAPDTDAAIRRYETLLARRAELAGRAADAPVDKAEPLLAELRGLVDEETTLADQLRRSAPSYWRLLRQQPITSADVRATLPAAQVMIHFGWLGDTLTVLHLDQRGASARLVALSPEAAGRLVAGFRGGLEPAGDGRFPTFDAATASTLFQRLVGPEIAGLDPGTTVLFVPSGPLHGLPFAALTTDPTDDQSWLVRRHPLLTSVSPGAWLSLRELQARPVQARAFLGVGNPRLTREAPAADEFVVSNALTLRSAARRAKSIAGLPALPDTETEVRRLERLFARASSRILLDADANEPRLRQQRLQDYDVLAFSTHGLLSGEVDGVDEPGLVLTPPSRISGPDDDGFLAASEVALLSLDADWVLLAACNTGRVTEGEMPTVGPLALSFHYAGARSLLVTHWPVASDATLELMGALVGNHDELGKARALQKAMIELVENGRYSHPGYWAAFFLLGS